LFVRCSTGTKSAEVGSAPAGSDDGRLNNQTTLATLFEQLADKLTQGAC
jgi:hypothetical protein